MKAIETRQLVKHYGSVRAVDGLNLNVERGEIYALLGMNGAGKTTAIRMLCGLTPPDAGDALVMGHSICREAAQVRCIAAVSPQETSVAPRLTAAENLDMIARIYGADKREAYNLRDSMLNELELTDVADRYAGKLSGGMQRRLSIAMALITRPQVLFLDEPTLGLDVLARRSLWKMIEKLRRRMTIVLTTHYLEEAEALSDRIGIMKHGRLAAEGTAAQLISIAGTAGFEDAFVALAAPGEVE